MSITEKGVPTSHDRGAVIPPDIYDPAVNALRFLAIDAIDRAVSGHPGAPWTWPPSSTGSIPVTCATTRRTPPGWTAIVSGTPAATPRWRSTGLHLPGYDTTLDDIRSVRQLGSRCAGHPERGLLPGIEVTTGPLGQGVANAVGMAIAERLLAQRFNRDGLDVVDHRVFAECGDGDLMEGISGEACSLAGHLGLGMLTLLYDNNRVSLDGPTSWTFTEDVATRYLAYGWHVVRLFDVDDFSAIDVALAQARRGDRAAHDHPDALPHRHRHPDPRRPPLPRRGGRTAEYAGIARGLLEWPYEPFQIPEQVYETWRSQVTERAESRQRWVELFERYRQQDRDLAAEFQRAHKMERPSSS